MVKHLQDGRGNLTVVGDDAQSIYGFRGATSRAFVLLSDVLEDSTVKVFSMTQNYRSHGPIIQVRYIRMLILICGQNQMGDHYWPSCDVPNVQGLFAGR